MIRVNRPVKLLEWGEGTNTLNQVWSELGQGNIVQHKQKDGLTTLTVKLNGPFQKKNLNDDAIKIVQKGEGLAARSEHWGEVAIGKLKAVDSPSESAIIYIDIAAAAKLGKAR